MRQEINKKDREIIRVYLSHESNCASIRFKSKEKLKRKVREKKITNDEGESVMKIYFC